MRRITLFVSAMLVALFVPLAISTSSVQAQEADGQVMATWSGDNLKYIQWSFIKDNDTASLVNLSGTKCATSQNVYFTDRTKRPTESGDFIGVICLDSTNKSEILKAPLIYYVVDDSNANNFRLNREESIEVAPADTPDGIPVRVPDDDTDTSTSDSNSDSSTSPCSSKYSYGLSWIVCPVTNWLAAGTDQLFRVLKGFLIVPPLLGENGTTLFYAWGIMRNFANILFIIAFLIIIYSQITSYGVSNYGIKRLLPRLVIAAVLVNMSYWISALAVDLSNILGMSLQSLFLEIRNTMPSSPDVTLDDLTFSSVAGAVLSSGAIGIGAGAVVLGTIATAGASIWFLLVTLVGVMVSALVAVLVLAARQALITILIIVSPLAFVAFLLPSTEKYFDRWKTIFVTLLMVFPILSVVFGGSQVAGLVIIRGALENPDNENFLNLIILGLAVQVIPFVITPLLVRLSGSIAGRIAGIVNNPNKGIVDKTRKFAQNRHDMTKNRRLWDWDSKNGRFRNNDPLAAGGRRMALREINNSHRLKAWESGATAAYEKDHRAHETYTQKAINEMRQKSGEDDAKAHFNRTIANLDNVRSLYYEQKQKSDEAETENKRVSSMYEGLKASPEIIAKNAMEREIGDRSKKFDRDERALSTREATAKQVQERAYNSLITDVSNAELRETAGYSEIDTQGVARIVNIAQEAESKTYENLVEAGRRTLLREEANLEELKDLIEKGTSTNPKFAHFSGDLESKSAAIRVFMEKAPMQMRHKLAADMDLSLNAPRGTAEGAFRSEIAGGLAKNKPFFISQTFLNEMAEGRLDPRYNGVEGRNLMIADTLNKFAFDAQSMVSIDQDDIGAIASFLNSPQRSLLTAEAEAQIKEALGKAFDKRDRYEGQMGKRRNNLNAVRKQLGLDPITK